jgi:hypothetical protein
MQKPCLLALLVPLRVMRTETAEAVSLCWPNTGIQQPRTNLESQDSPSGPGSPATYKGQPIAQGGSRRGSAPSHSLKTPWRNVTASSCLGSACRSDARNRGLCIEDGQTAWFLAMGPRSRNECKGTSRQEGCRSTGE